MVLLVLIPVAWATIAVLVVAICRMAARGDAMPARSVDARLPGASAVSGLAVSGLSAVYSPRRPTTCGTVRSRILTSVHNDQLAT